MKGLKNIRSVRSSATYMSTLCRPFEEKPLKNSTCSTRTEIARLKKGEEEAKYKIKRKCKSCIIFIYFFLHSLLISFHQNLCFEILTLSFCFAVSRLCTPFFEGLKILRFSWFFARKWRWAGGVEGGYALLISILCWILRKFTSIWN